VHERSLVALPITLTKRPGAQVLHGVHDDALLTMLKEPVAHGLHWRLVTAEPGMLTSWPAPQMVQGRHGLAGLRSWSQVPLPHACGGVSVPAQYSPALQLMQAAGMSGPPADTCFVPAAQEPCGTHWPALIVAENVPGEHGAQAWSAREVPAMETYVPGWQTAHAAHRAALDAALNCPEGHAVHTRSCSADPTVLT